MAVYKRTYSRYTGRLTSLRWRFLVIARHEFGRLEGSRFLTFLFMASLVWPLICALIIYLHFNLSALQLMKIDASRLIPINSGFFLAFLGFQSMLAFFMNAFIGPGLVAPDLANNGLPLYFSRPISRAEYVLGKVTVLVSLLSLMTWIPGLLLFGLQSYLAGSAWMWENLRIAAGLFLGSWIWISLLALLSLAMSAWVKWKPLAGALLFGIFFVATGFGAAINAVLHTRWGNLINLSHLVGSVWVSLFEVPSRRGAGTVFFRVGSGEALPAWVCWAALGGICLFCLWLLGRKIRAVEVVA